MIPKAKIDAFAKAPPVKAFKRPNNPSSVLAANPPS